MTPTILRDKLAQSAVALGWAVSEAPAFTSSHFRGRTDDPRSGLPKISFGLRLGAFPVLVAPITLEGIDEMKLALRALHSQMVIARSYMRPEEVINAHIMLCATSTSELADWRQVVDFSERDETVCRKVIWIPQADALKASYAAFLARTFLATPWLAAETTLNAPLDRNRRLAQRTLIRHGLSEAAAERWVLLAEQYGGDPDTLVAQLAQTRSEA